MPRLQVSSFNGVVLKCLPETLRMTRLRAEVKHVKEGFRHKEEQSKDREGADFFEEVKTASQGDWSQMRSKRLSGARSNSLLGKKFVLFLSLQCETIEGIKAREQHDPFCFLIAWLLYEEQTLGGQKWKHRVRSTEFSKLRYGCGLDQSGDKNGERWEDCGYLQDE